MRVRVHNTLDDLTSDLAKIPAMAARDMGRTVKEAGRVGNVVARDNALRTSGTHGGPPKGHYTRSFSADYLGVSGGFGHYAFATEYGPDASKQQGNMSFEGGSRKQPPHNDLAKSADLMGPALQGEVRRLPEKWFWPR